MSAAACAFLYIEQETYVNSGSTFELDGCRTVTFYNAGTSHARFRYVSKQEWIALAPGMQMSFRGGDHDEYKGKMTLEFDQKSGSRNLFYVNKQVVDISETIE